MRLNRALLIIVSLISITSFGQDEKHSELKNLLHSMQTDEKIVSGLEPEMGDLQSMFISVQDVGDVWMHVQDVYTDDNHDLYKIDESLSQCKVHTTMGAHLKTGDKHDLPAKYSSLGGHLKDDVNVFSIECSNEDGSESKTVDGFYHIKGNWFWIPNTWMAFE